MPYLKINADCSKPPIEAVELPQDPTEWLHACYDCINCDTIDVVPTVFSRIMLVVDDNGKMFDNWEANINQVATILYGNPYDCIVGDCLVALRNGCDLVPLPEDVAQWLVQKFE